VTSEKFPAHDAYFVRTVVPLVITLYRIGIVANYSQSATVIHEAKKSTNLIFWYAMLCASASSSQSQKEPADTIFVNSAMYNGYEKQGFLLRSF
jgi:hypothetical protein